MSTVRPASPSAPRREKPRRPPLTASPDRRRVRPGETGLRTRSGARPLLLLLVMALCVSLLVARLAYWALMENGHLAAAAKSQRASLNVQQPVRGEIFDSRGHPLATNFSVSAVYAAPRQIKDPRGSARLMAPVLGMSTKYVYDLFTSTSSYVRVAAQVSPSVSQQIRNLALPGIILDPQVRREYPQGSSAAQVLGFANANNQGNYGIEGYYDRLLSGSAGWRSVLRDTAGESIHLSSGPASPSQNGANLTLSLDPVVQSLAEDEIQKAVKKHSALSGTIIVMDPRTGYILGMASAPSFNPNQYATVTNSSRYLNPAIQWTYEPGSTFKIITMAAGLNTHVITPQSAFDDTGAFQVTPTFTVHNWNMSGFGWENMIQVLQHSANVGASWVAQRLGASNFYHYVKAFRFGQPTGVDLEGEWPGAVPTPGSKTWTIDNLYTNSYGQGISVTPLQLIRAVAAVANGGVMMKPQVVTHLEYDGRIIDHPPVSQGRVISAQTAHTLTDMLVHSAVGGEASLALVKGYNIAAKTGTANIPAPNGGYLANATIASIVGYAPAFHPRFVALVIINRPRDTPWGSMAAAPVMHNLFQDLFMYYHIPPSPHAINR